MTAKLLDLAEGRETPESWRGWWDEHEPKLETLSAWAPALTSQKGATAILEKSGTAFGTSNLSQERYLAE